MVKLAARRKTGDRVAGLDAVADDYVPKPFDLSKLPARLRALLRRASFVPDTDGEAVNSAPRRVVRWADQELTFSKTELDLLEQLARNEGVMLDRKTVDERVWGHDFGGNLKNLAVYFGAPRRELAGVGAGALLRAVRCVGHTVCQP